MEEINEKGSITNNAEETVETTTVDAEVISAEKAVDKKAEKAAKKTAKALERSKAKEERALNKAAKKQEANAKKAEKAEAKADWYKMSDEERAQVKSEKRAEKAAAKVSKKEANAAKKAEKAEAKANWYKLTEAERVELKNEKKAEKKTARQEKVHLVLTNISDKAVKAKVTITNSKFAKFTHKHKRITVGAGIIVLCGGMFLAGKKLGAIDSQASLSDVFGLRGCGKRVEATVTPTPSVTPTFAPTATPTATPTVAPTATPTPVVLPQSIVESNAAADSVYSKLEEREMLFGMTSEEVRKAVAFIRSNEIGEDFDTLNISQDESIDLFCKLGGNIVTNNILIDMDMNNQIDLAILFANEDDKALATKFYALKEEIIKGRLAGKDGDKDWVNKLMKKVISFYTKDLSSTTVSPYAVAVLEKMGWEDLKTSYLNLSECQLLLTKDNKLMYNLVDEMCISGNRHNVIFEEKAKQKTLR